ncbi:MAG TPA: hypothetical protein VHS27_14825 [Gaiellales bacterium]|nr:hypothetical protein [Gaiellales bacterium]
MTDTDLPVAGLREEEIESRWEAAPAVGIVIVMQAVLALVSRNQVWQLWVFPWWVWLIPIVPEVLLLLPLAWRRPRRRLEQLPRMSDPITATEQQHVRQADDGEEGERDRAVVAS